MNEYPDFHGDMPITSSVLVDVDKKCTCNKDCNCSQEKKCKCNSCECKK